jgi:uncharacterized membrane protein
MIGSIATDKEGTVKQNIELANWIATAVTLLTASLLIILSIPMIQGSVKPNRVYGFRTVKKLSDEKVCYSANRLMGRDLLVAGAAVLIAAIVLLVANRSFTNLPVAILDVTVMLVARHTNGTWVLGAQENVSVGSTEGGRIA